MCIWTWFFLSGQKRSFNTSPIYPHFFASSLHNCGSTIQTTRKSVLKYFKKTKMGQNSISYIGPKVWNKLPSQCKLEKNPNNFKHKIKEEFFKNIQRENDDIYIYY